jgi:CheY-like chemotaxis protein
MNAEPGESGRIGTPRQASGADAEAGTRGPVLVVTQDPLLGSHFRSELEGLGYRSEESAGVAETLERMAATPPQLVLLDLCVERGRGISLMRSLLGDHDLPHVPVLIAGSEPGCPAAREAVALGAGGPVSLDAGGLSGWIARALERAYA